MAEKAGVYAFGQASDMDKFAPKAVLTSVENNWGPYYVDRVKAVAASASLPGSYQVKAQTILVLIFGLTF